MKKFDPEASAMPHADVNLIVILRTNEDGKPTRPMAYAQAQTYLVNVMKDNNRDSCIKQALNDVTSGKGKPTGAYVYLGSPVWHASSGDARQARRFSIRLPEPRRPLSRWANM